MPRRAATPGEPRAHWVLMALLACVVLAGLALHGTVTHPGAEGDGGGPSGAPGPPAVTGAAAVQRPAGAGTVTSRAMPPRTIALTFDDGPDPTWTPRVLDVLARHRAPATFFVIGSQVDRHPGIVRRAGAEGHEIGSHTFTHIPVAGTPRWRLAAELALTRDAVAAVTGRRPVLMRPPYSSTPDAATRGDAAALPGIAAAGHLVVLTDLDTVDWQRPGADRIAAAARPTGDAGAIVMLHDAGGDRSQTVAALDLLIPELRARGYRFTTVSQALGLPGAPAATTAERLRGDAVRHAQNAATTLAGALLGVLLLAFALTTARLAAQLWATRRHRRATARTARRPAHRPGTVSVVVPAHDEAATIAATVRALAADDYPDLEIVVVDDGSTDGTADIVETLGLPGVLVRRQPNAGKAAALDAGVRYARGDVLVLVDADTVPEPGTVGRLVQPFADPAVGAVSGNTKIANRGGLLGRWQHLEYVMGFNLDRRLFDVARCMPTVPGAVGAFRRAALDQAGGVPGATLAEDTDLTLAVVRGGWRVVYQPTAVAWTEAPATLPQLWRQRHRWCYGTLQALWRHRHALTQRGTGGRLGRRALLSVLLMQILLPLSAPAVDLFALYGLFFLPAAPVAATWTACLLAQAAVAAYALRLDGESLRPLWSLPLQQVVYRQLMYLVVVQSCVTALLGGRLRWHRVARSGAAVHHAPPAVPGRLAAVPLTSAPPTGAPMTVDLQAVVPPVGAGKAVPRPRQTADDLAAGARGPGD